MANYRLSEEAKEYVGIPEAVFVKQVPNQIVQVHLISLKK